MKSVAIGTPGEGEDIEAESLPKRILCSSLSVCRQSKECGQSLEWKSRASLRATGGSAIQHTGREGDYLRMMIVWGRVGEKRLVLAHTPRQPRNDGHRSPEAARRTGSRSKSNSAIRLHETDTRLSKQDVSKHDYQKSLSGSEAHIDPTAYQQGSADIMHLEKRKLESLPAHTENTAGQQNPRLVSR